MNTKYPWKNEKTKTKIENNNKINIKILKYYKK